MTIWSETTRHRCLSPPPVSAHHVRRHRLSGWINSPLPSAVIATAPAWFGKTTLLREWHDRLKELGVTTLWVSAKELAEERTSLTEILLPSLDATESTRKLRRKTPIERNSSLEACTALLQNTARIALLIDDAPSLPQSMQSELSALIRHSSESCLFVLSSRGELPANLSAIWAHGRSLSFTERDIALDIDEVDSMAGAAGAGLTRHDCETLLDKTGGWVGAVKVTLDANASSRTNGERPLESLRRTQSVLFRVIEDATLEKLPRATLKFLEEISILETLTVSSCGAVSDAHDSDTHLQTFKKIGGFIREDHAKPDTYRLNPLLRELLNRRLQSRPSAVKNLLHERASRWYADNGSIADALDHSMLTGNLRFHAANLERFCEDMVYRGQIHLLEKYTAGLPTKTLHSLPHLSLVIAWWRTRQYRFVEAEELLDSVRKSISRDTRSKHTRRLQRGELAPLLKHRELTLRSARSAIPISGEECQRLIADFSSTNNDGLKLNLYAQLFASYRRQYRITEILKLEAQASELAERCGIVTFTPWMRAELGAAHVECGRISVARRLFERSLEDALRFEGVGPGLSALSGLYLADLCYEADDRVNASRLIETHLPAAREFGLVDQLVTAYTVQAKLFVAERDIDRALSTLEDGMRFSEERQLDRLRRCLQGERVRLLSAVGTPTTLDEVAASSLSRRNAKDSDTEIHDAARARILLSKARHTEVLRLANSWISFCTGNLAVRTLTRWQLIRTHALLLSGDMQNARRSLREALTGAARGGFLRKIVDSAPPVRTLLLESYRATASQTNEIDVFAKKAINIISANTSAERKDEDQHLGATGAGDAPLTPKEREILTLVAGGLQNREIGERLGITEGTVKWHMQQIFMKLGVRRRAQAISVLHGSS